MFLLNKGRFLLFRIACSHEKVKCELTQLTQVHFQREFTHIGAFSKRELTHVGRERGRRTIIFKVCPRVKWHHI